MSRRIEGDDRPKQFCRVLGPEPLLTQTRRRSGLLVPARQTVVLVTAAHRRFFQPLLRDIGAGGTVIQPENRGTVPAVLWGLLRIAALAPMASAVILPSDHYVSDDAVFMSHVAMAYDIVDARPELVVLLGIPPDRPEPEFGWIQPGAAVHPGRWKGLQRVQGFHEKPARGRAEALLAAGALWNSFVIVARVPTLMTLIRQAATEVWSAFEPVVPWIGTSREAIAATAAYAACPSVGLSDAVLTRRPANLAVLRVEGVGWNDLGAPRRVLETLAATGITPAWSLAAAGAGRER
jgi:mannose-1-phosphate guanylyltransferase